MEYTKYKYKYTIITTITLVVLFLLTFLLLFFLTNIFKNHSSIKNININYDKFGILNKTNGKCVGNDKTKYSLNDSFIFNDFKSPKCNGVISEDKNSFIALDSNGFLNFYKNGNLIYRFLSTSDFSPEYIGQFNDGIFLVDNNKKDFVVTKYKNIKLLNNSELLEYIPQPTPPQLTPPQPTPIQETTKECKTSDINLYTLKNNYPLQNGRMFGLCEGLISDDTKSMLVLGSDNILKSYTNGKLIKEYNGTSNIFKPNYIEYNDGKIKYIDSKNSSSGDLISNPTGNYMFLNNNANIITN